MKQWTMFDQEVFDRFVRPGTGEIIEVRGLNIFGKNPGVYEGYARGTIAGYFDNLEDFTKAVKPATKVSGLQLYMTLQVINPDLIGRAFNRLKAATTTVGDADVQCFRWFPVDLDPIRPSGISSSDEELAKAMDLREKVYEYCVESYKFRPGWKGVSGNGTHILFPLDDLPAQDPDVQKVIKRLLSELDAKFSNKDVSIDQTVGNAGRIWRLMGSRNSKGDPVPGGPHRTRRPHRWSYFDFLGE